MTNATAPVPTSAATLEPAPTGPTPQHKTVLIPLDSIVLIKNDRFTHSPESIAELARELKKDGQWHPLVVRMVKGKHELIAGERRYLANKLNEEKMVPAIIVEADDAKARDMRLAENAQRVDLSEAEYALAVARIYETTTGTREARIATTAARVSKGLTWVRDRLYLATTTEKVRALVHAKRLPLEHARELAKVCDPRKQDELAAAYAGSEDGTESPDDLDGLRDDVKRCMRSLTVVPWDKAVKVPGVNAPACKDCPQNTANDRMLFEHAPEPQDGEQCLGRDDGGHMARTSDGGPHCLNAACFRQKLKASEKIIKGKAKVVAKHVQREEIPCSPKRLGENELVPTGVDPQAFATQVRREIKGPGAAGRVSESREETRPGAGMTYKPDPFDAKARTILDAEDKAWTKSSNAAFEKAFPRASVSALAWFLMQETGLWDSATGYGSVKGVPPKLAQLIDKAIKASTLKDVLALFELAEEKFDWEAAGVFGSVRDPYDAECGDELRAYILKKIAPDLKPLGDWNARYATTLERLRAEKEKPAAKDAKPAKKAKGKKKGGGK